MPILPKEIELHPVDLLDPERAATVDRWLAVYTISRREKELMRRLVHRDIPFYCPLIPHRNRSSSGRIRISHLPLFAGYVFVGGGHDVRSEVLKTNCTSQTLEVRDPESLVHDLRQIKRLIDCDARLTPESRIGPGDHVRVRRGPLTGIEGVVVKRHNGDRLVVSVQFLQKGASVALDDFEVELV